MNPQVSIIIVNYNSQQTLGRCIDSIDKFVSEPTCEIIVVDNASAPESVRFIKEKYPRVKCIENTENKGFGAANNIGVQQAAGKYLFFLNPDAILTNNAVIRFYDFLEKASLEVVSCGGNLIKENGELTTSYGNFPSLLQEWSDIGFRRFYPQYYDKYLCLGKTCKKETRPFCVPYITGADIFIRKAAFQRVGGFDERFFLYYEETDLFYRLSRMGYDSYILPDVKIIHLEGPSMLKDGELNYEKWAFWEKSKYYYFRKNRGRFAAGTAKGMQIFSLILHRLFGTRAYKLRKALKITRKA